MDYIAAEQFLKQPKEVQKVFLDWWKPQMHDLFFRDFRRENDEGQFLRGIYIGCIQDNETKINAERSKSSDIEYAPFTLLFTEGQLRKFIEDKAKNTIKLIHYHPYDNDIAKEGYEIDLLDIKNVSVTDIYTNLGTDLLQAYWKVACKIATNEVSEIKSNEVMKQSLIDDIHKTITGGKDNEPLESCKDR
jgi:hypothetical protein